MATNDYYYLGLMSGTSLDGIDAALVGFEHSATRLIDRSFTPYPTQVRDKLGKITTANVAVKLPDLLQLDHDIGLAFAAAASPFGKKYGNQIKAIGSHGQTLYHAPGSANSWQLGNPNLIAERTGITTIADFRRRDMAAGGQGAPLTPAFHADQFSSDIATTVLNLGGIANITILAANSDDRKLQGFDTGPANTLLDQWINRTKGLAYDNNGEWAEEGKIHEPLLESLLTDPFFSQHPPKSTGTEHFNLRWLNEHIKQLDNEIAAVDIQATLLQLTATSVLNAIELHAPDTERVILCGGGAHNRALIKRLEKGRPASDFLTSSELGVDSDHLEAMAFAWFAKQTMERKPIDLTNVTGAKHPVILGAIYPSAIT